MSSSFIKALLGVPLTSELFLFEDGEEFIAIGYFENNIFTSKIPTDKLSDSVQSPVPIQFQEHQLQNDVITIFKWSEKFFVLDSAGCIYQMNITTVDEETLDFFEDSTEEVSSIELMHQIKVSRVLSACLIQPDSLALVHQNQEDRSIVFQKLSLNSYLNEQQIIVKRNCISQLSKPILLYVDPLDVKNEFISSWFPHFKPNELNRGYIFIFNCEESACCIQLGFDTLRVGFFFSWPSPCVFSFYRRLNCGNNSLLLGFEDGAVVSLCSSGGQIIHITPFNIRCGYEANGALFLSDYSDCQFLRLNPPLDSCLLPIKGIICFIHLGNQLFKTAALTNYGTIYLLKSDFNLNERSSIIPTAVSFEETVKNIGYLEQLNSKIAACDKTIKCLSTAMNAKNFKFSLFVQVVQILAENHLLRVTCKASSNGHNDLPYFGSDEWYVAVTLTAEPTNRIVHVQQLTQDFSRTQPLELMIPWNLASNHSRDYLVHVKLISFVKGKNYCPLISIGKVHLNTTHFLEPEHSLSIYSSPAVTHCFAIERLLKSLESYQEPSVKTIRPERLFTIKILTDQPIERSFVEKLLENSRALWRTVEWETTCAKKDIYVVVGGKKVLIQFKENEQWVLVSSADLALATQMKYAVLNSTKPIVIKGFNEKMLVEAENLLKILEVMEFSTNGLSSAGLIDIFKRKVKFINDPLTSCCSFVT